MMWLCMMWMCVHDVVVCACCICVRNAERRFLCSLSNIYQYERREREVCCGAKGMTVLRHAGIGSC